MTSTLVIFLGSGVPVSSTSTFWYTLGEFSHLERSVPLPERRYLLQKTHRKLELRTLLKNLKPIQEGVLKPSNKNQQITRMLMQRGKSYPWRYNSSSSRRKPREETAGGTSISFLGLGGSFLIRGWRYK